MDKQLKIFALEYIKEHDGLLKEERLALGQFVMEASDNQVKFMLLTGEVKDNLIEGDLKYLKEIEFEWGIIRQIYQLAQNKDYPVGVTHGIQKALTGVAIAAAATTVAAATYKRFFSKGAKACKGKTGNERIICLGKFKKEARLQKIKALETGINACSKSKNPDICKGRIKPKIAKEKAKMGAL